MKYLMICLFLTNIAYAKSELLFGNFTYNDDQFDFFVKRVSQDDQYEFEIKNKSTQKKCVFEVRRLTAPVQTVSMSGDLSVYPNQCELGSSKKEFSFRLINISFRFNEDSTLIGNVTIPKYLYRKKLDFIDFKK